MTEPVVPCLDHVGHERDGLVALPGDDLQVATEARIVGPLLVTLLVGLRLAPVLGERQHAHLEHRGQLGLGRDADLVALGHRDASGRSSRSGRSISASQRTGA